MAFAQRHGYYSTRSRVGEWMKTLYQVEYAVERARIAALWAEADEEPSRMRRTRSVSEGVLELEPTVRQVTDTLPGWAPAGAEKPAILRDWEPSLTRSELRRSMDGPTEQVTLSSPVEPRLDSVPVSPMDLAAGSAPETTLVPVPLCPADLAHHIVEVSPPGQPHGDGYRLPLPPSPEDSGEISLGALPPKRPGAACPTVSPAAAYDACQDASDAGESDAEAGRSPARWKGWTGWPTVTTVALALGAALRALSF